MQVTDISLSNLVPAPWNSNAMDRAMLARLAKSVNTFGFLEPLIVRDMGDGEFEIIGGSHRFQVLKETDAVTAPCVIVEADDESARLLSQALNHIEGEDDPAMRAESLRRILAKFSESDVLSILPETSKSLAELSNFGSLTPEMYARSWQARKAVSLKHVPFQVTEPQLAVVDQAISVALEFASPEPGNPNRRGNALVHICREFIEGRKPL